MPVSRAWAARAQRCLIRWGHRKALDRCSAPARQPRLQAARRLLPAASARAAARLRMRRWAAPGCRARPGRKKESNGSKEGKRRKGRRKERREQGSSPRSNLATHLSVNSVVLAGMKPATAGGGGAAGGGRLGRGRWAVWAAGSGQRAWKGAEQSSPPERHHMQRHCSSAPSPSQPRAIPATATPAAHPPTTK